MDKKYDVIVLGGGTAGVPAAIAAARGGAKTLVIERFGHLGGTAVYGIPFLGVISAAGEVVNKGLLQEILERAKEENGYFGYAEGAYWNTPGTPEKYKFSLVPFDLEIYKYVAQEMILEAGGEILYYSQLSGAEVKNGKIEWIEVVNKSGRQRYCADVYIDCSGDADLVYAAGGSFQKKDKLQNCSMLFRIGGVDLNGFLEDLRSGEKIKGWGSWHTRVIYAEKAKGELPALVHLAGHLTPQEDGKETTFTAVSFRDGEISLNASRTVGCDCKDANGLSLAEISERRNVMSLFKQMKNNIPSFYNSYIMSTSPVGVRETRNILGDYTLTKEDVLSGTDFDDGVARGAYPIDIHDPAGGRTSFQFIADGGWYSVPYRCLLPAGLDGVLAAGRCISASHEANGTTRIMGCVAAQGEAAGTAAALAVKNKTLPRAIDVKALRSLLKQNGGII